MTTVGMMLRDEIDIPIAHIENSQKFVNYKVDGPMTNIKSEEKVASRLQNSEIQHHE